MNEGKIFENQFKNSVPKNVWFYRFKDSPATFDKETKSITRFSTSNICDCELFYERKLFLLELKSIKQTSIPLKNFIDESKKSSKKKFNDMIHAFSFDGIHPGYIVNFRKYNRTYFMPVYMLKQCIDSLNRKSIHIGYFESNCIVLPQKKKRTTWKYDLSRLLNCEFLNYKDLELF